MSAGPEIWCVGGAWLDWIGRASAPLSTVGSTPGRVASRPGGVALNVAMRLAAQGRRAALIAPVGRDPAGAALAEALAAAGVRNALIETDQPTGAYLAIEGPDGVLSRAIADSAALDQLSPKAIVGALAGRPEGAAVFFDANLTSDQIAAILATRPGFVAANAVSAVKAPRLTGHLSDLDALFCNLAEAEALLSRPVAGAAEAAGALAALCPGAVFVTDGPRPAAAAEAGLVFEAAPRPIAAGGETGAGDAFTAAALDHLTRGEAADAALKAGLIAGADILEAAQ